MAHRLLVLGLAALLAACASSSTISDAPAPPAMPPEAAAAGPQTFSVMLAPGHDPKAGRLIVTAAPASAVRIATGASHPAVVPASGWVAAQQAPIVSPGQPTRLDADMLAFPTPMSRIRPGEYWVQVRLDTNLNAAYRFADGTDFTSIPVKMQLPTREAVRITLQPEAEVNRAAIGTPTIDMPAPSPLDREADGAIRELNFLSPSLSEFWGRDVHIRGVVLVPPNYEATGERYPAVYRTEGFGGSLASIRPTARRHYAMMKNGDTPPMIRVFLDHSSPWGTHEFADSVNNGPWGKALTEELIPWLEGEYKMDGEPSGRFTTGHSSGGWFAIWQQVRYPEVFGGTWARAPDPVDFRSFTGVDIYRAGANAYVRPDGSEQYLVRDAAGQKTTSLKDYAQRENVLGDFGGQFDSFDWVFSPRGNDGRPQPLFDRMTGKIDPDVAEYWRTYYDISHILKRDWVSLKPVLDGKIHLIMGTMDTFHLDEAAKLLETELKAVGAKADFVWMDGRGHGNLDRIGDDPMGLEKKIAWEMWAVARPKSDLRPPKSSGAAP